VTSQQYGISHTTPSQDRYVARTAACTTHDMQGYTDADELS
jgi:hypothetical protein